MNYSLSSLGIDGLNGMQQEMLEASRRYRNLILLSPTGSGKTLAYLVSCNVDTGVLVLVPSRELAVQTRDVATRLYPGLKTYACYGGRAAMDEHRQIREIHPSFFAGTPGRVLDHLQKGNIDASAIHTLVIDEFDKSLELGFQDQMREILSLLPNVGRRILLSATDNKEIPDFIGIDDVHKLNFLDVDDYEGRIEQFYLKSPEKDKLRTLESLLRSRPEQTWMIFLGFRDAVGRVSDFLMKMGFSISSFHGGMEQRDRERSLFRFKCGAANILVCTDLASRGLDIDGVDNIVHYHLPLNEETFIHRNGRTARWDKVGNSFLIIGPQEVIPDFSESTEIKLSQKLPAATPSVWEVLYIGKGKKDKVNKVDVVGFLSKTGGLQRDEIGLVSVFPSWCFAAIKKNVVKPLLHKIKGQKIKGQKTIFEVMH